MKRIYSLFFVMLLCLVGSVANAAVYGLPSSLASQGGIVDGKAKAVKGYAGKVSGNNVYYIPVGRVFIKSNAAPRVTGDGDMYMTSLVNVMGIGEGATNYWSVWNITFNEDDQTVYIQNEGNRDIMTPLQKYSSTATRDNGYLYYTGVSPVGYAVGDTDNDSYKRFTWDIITSNGPSNGTYKFGPKGKSTVLMYLCAQGNSRGSNEWGNNNYGDHVVKSGLRTNNYYSDTNTNGTTYRQAQWNIIPLTPEMEAEMYARNVQELNGYVGGVVTLTNVDAVDALSKINQNSDADVETILEGATDGAKKMKQILGDMASAGEFSQELIEGRPFFLENLCTYRPSLYSHLFRNGTTSWITSSNAVDIESTPQAVFYVNKVGANYTLRDANGYYISNATSPVPTTGNARLNFVIDPVVPGIWQIRNVNNNTNPFLTINDNNRLTHYNVSEVSTLWKFKSYTTLDYSLQADPEGSNIGYTTYGQYLDSKLPADGKLEAWAAQKIVWDNNEMMITMALLPTSKDKMGATVYWLRGGEGYLITKKGTSKTDAGTVNTNQEARFIPSEDYDNNLPVFYTGANFFRPTLVDGVVTEDNWEKNFYLSYVETGKTYTHWGGEDVKGYGVGFYRLQPGKTYKSGKAYITFADVFEDESKHVPKANWNTKNAKGQMIFVDNEGETTDIVTISEDGSLYREVNTYFDLSGRRVAQPVKGGVYIKNGKKVLY